MPYHCNFLIASTFSFVTFILQSLHRILRYC